MVNIRMAGLRYLHSLFLISTVAQTSLETEAAQTTLAPTFWHLRPWWVVGVVLFCLLETALIVALLIRLANRRLEGSTRSREERSRQELAGFSGAAAIQGLMSWLAHELNQPLAAILGNAQAAKNLMERGTTDSKELREICEDLVADSHRAAGVVRAIRSRFKRPVAELQPLVLEDLIQEIIPVVRNDNLARNVSIDLDLGLSLPSIRGDRIQLQQVIHSLVVNALEAMESSEGLRKLVLRTRQSGRTVVLDVVDSGPGIPGDKLDAIFDMFVTTKPAALGIGLSLSRSIMIAHNGRLWAENNSDGGATVHLEFPVEESLRAGPAAAANQNPPDDARQQAHGLTVLIADDRQAFRKALSSILTALPHLWVIAEAADGAEAIRKSAELNPDLILLDLGLPVINGVEAAARIHSVVPNARILFLTQHDSPDFVGAALRAGALGYVLKVDVGSELLQAATAVLRGERYLSSGVRHSGYPLQEFAGSDEPQI